LRALALRANTLGQHAVLARKYTCQSRLPSAHTVTSYTVFYNSVDKLVDQLGIDPAKLATLSGGQILELMSARNVDVGMVTDEETLLFFFVFF
jgi:hypothetical protein